MNARTKRGWIIGLVAIVGFLPCYSQIEAASYYKGGYKHLKNDIWKNMALPMYISHRCIQGPVMVEFNIHPDGTIDSIRVIQSLCVDCDSAVVNALRALKKSKWQVDSVVRTRFTVVIEFHHSQCKNSDYYANQGIELFNKKEYKEALDAFSTAVKINPLNTEALYGRGMTNIILGNKWDGCADLEDAARLGHKEALTKITFYCR